MREAITAKANGFGPDNETKGICDAVEASLHHAYRSGLADCVPPRHAVGGKRGLAAEASRYRLSSTDLVAEEQRNESIRLLLCLSDERDAGNDSSSGLPGTKQIGHDPGTPTVNHMICLRLHIHKVKIRTVDASLPMDALIHSRYSRSAAPRSH